MARKILTIAQVREALSKGGPYIGPRGGKYADPQHKIAWRESIGRKGPRTGSIPISEARVAFAVEEMLEGTRADRHGVVRHLGRKSTEVPITNARGQTKRVAVRMYHDSGMKDLRGVRGQHQIHARPTRSGVIIEHSVAVYVNPKRGWERDALGRAMRSVLAHELTHAADPGLEEDAKRRAAAGYAAALAAGDSAPRRPPKVRQDYVTYLNQPHEVTASIQQIKRDITDSYVAGEIKGDPEWLRPEALLNWSERYKDVGHHYTEKNRRRVLRAIFDIRESLLAGTTKEIEKALRRAELRKAGSHKYKRRRGYPGHYEYDYGYGWGVKPPKKPKDPTLHERFGHQGAPKPGEKGYRPPPQATEGALDGRAGAEMASSMFDAATALLDDPELPALIHPEWEAEWHGSTERYDTPQDELEEGMADLADLIGVPRRGLDGAPAPLQDRSDFAHNMLSLAAQVRDGGPPVGTHYLSEAGEWTAEIKGEYLQDGWRIPRWAAVASIEDRLTGKTKNRLVLVPKEEAFAFVKEHHSVLGEGHKLPPGTMYAIGIKRGHRLVAVALAGHPTGGAMKRKATPRSTVELTRVASDGTTRNAASMLTARILDVLERSKRDADAPSLFVTYSLLSESGTTYRALKDKGLRPVAMTRPKKTMTGARTGGKGLANLPKIRWEAGEDAAEAKWGLLDLTSTGFKTEGGTHARSMEHAEKLAALIQAEGLNYAKVWGKPGVGTRVYFPNKQFLHVGMDGSVSDDSHRRGQTYNPSALYKKQRAAVAAGRKAHRKWHQAALQAEEPLLAEKAAYGPPPASVTIGGKARKRMASNLRAVRHGPAAPSGERFQRKLAERAVDNPDNAKALEAALAEHYYKVREQDPTLPQAGVEMHAARKVWGLMQLSGVRKRLLAGTAEKKPDEHGQYDLFRSTTMAELRKAAPKGGGWQRIPHPKGGGIAGYRRKKGGKWQYYYPERGLTRGTRRFESEPRPEGVEDFESVKERWIDKWVGKPGESAAAEGVLLKHYGEAVRSVIHGTPLSAAAREHQESHFGKNWRREALQIYFQTQRKLREQGIKSTKLFRGVSLHQARTHELPGGGADVEIGVYALSSWTSNTSAAKHFAGWSKPPPPQEWGRVVASEVSTADIFLDHRVERRLHRAGEREVIVSPKIPPGDRVPAKVYAKGEDKGLRAYLRKGEVSIHIDETHGTWLREVRAARGSDLRKSELRKAGPYVGPKGGLWADAKHTISWREHIGRKGPRTGAIAVSDATVRAAVDDLMTKPALKHGVVPTAEYVTKQWTTELEIKDASGKARQVTVRVEPSEEAARSPKGISGVLRSHLSWRRGGKRNHEMEHTIVLRPKTSWAGSNTEERKAAIARAFRDVLSHELTHLADPGIRKQHERMVERANRGEDVQGDEGKTRDNTIVAHTAYLNQPVEVTASIQQIKRDITDAKVAGQIKDDPEWMRPEALLHHSDRWEQVGEHYTEKNKRRVLRAIYDIRESLLAGTTKAIRKSAFYVPLTKAGPCFELEDALADIKKSRRVLSWGAFLRKSPFIGIKGGLWDDAQHTRPWRKGKTVHPSHCPRCKGVAHIVSRQSAIGGDDAVSSAPCRTCNRGGKHKFDEKRAKALGLPIPPPKKKAKRAPPEREQPSRHPAGPDPRQAGLFDKPEPKATPKRKAKPYRYGQPGIGSTRRSHRSPHEARLWRERRSRERLGQEILKLAHTIPASLFKARPGGKGWMLIPKGRRGGYRRRQGKGWEYWYPQKKATTRQLGLFDTPPDPEPPKPEPEGQEVSVYRADWAKGKQPPGSIMDPKAAAIVGAQFLGNIRVPPTGGVRRTPLGHLRGVPVATLAMKPGIVAAYRAGKDLPPIEIEVTDGQVQLVDGHHRLSAAREAGLESIPVKWHLRHSADPGWAPTAPPRKHNPEHVPGDDAPPDDDRAARWDHAKEMSRDVRLKLDKARERGVHYFPSGSNLPGEILGLADAGLHVGVAVQTLRKKGGIEAIAQAVREHPETRVFVDSGAFSEAIEHKNGPPTLYPPDHPKGISHAEWIRRLGRMRRIGEDIGGQLYAVAPDAVAHQDKTLERMARYAELVRKIAATGANILIPCQKGDLDLPTFWKRALEILGIPEAQAVASIPMMKDATSAQDYGDFLERAKPARVHLLGLGPKGRRFPGILSITEKIAPTTELSCDSVLLSSIVGWFSGPALPEADVYLTESGEEVPFKNAVRPYTEVHAGVLAELQDNLFTQRQAEMTGWDWSESSHTPSTWLTKAGLERFAKALRLEPESARAFVRDPDSWLQVEARYLDPRVERELEAAWKGMLAPDRQRTAGKPRMPDAPASVDYRKRETIRRLFAPEAYPYDPIDPVRLREMQTTVVPATPQRRVRLHVINGERMITPEQKAQPPSAGLLAVMDKDAGDPGEWELPAGARVRDPWVPKAPKPGATWSHPDYGSGTGAAPWQQQDDWHPDLHSYDHIVINSSAGKDSQAMLTRLVELADEQGYPREKLLVVHADLGRVEWAGTLPLAQEQAEHYGIRFEVVKRQQNDLIEQIEERHGDLTQKDADVGKLHEAGFTSWDALVEAKPEDVLAVIGEGNGSSKWPGAYRAKELVKRGAAKLEDLRGRHVKKLASLRKKVDKAHAAVAKAKSPKAREKAETRVARWTGELAELRTLGEPGQRPINFGKAIAWPSSDARYCTSDHKRVEVNKLITALADAHKAKTGSKKPARILNALGLRAQESASRAAMDAFGRQTDTSNQTVDRWYPVHRWHESRVWDVIEESGVPYHEAYDLGMRRLSCAFCVFAQKSDLMVAAAHNPDLFHTYLELEEKVGASFKADMSLAEVRDEISARRAAGWSLNDLAEWVPSGDLAKAETEVRPTTVGLVLEAAIERLEQRGQKIRTLTLDWKANGLCVHLDTAVDSHHVEHLPYPAAYNASMVAAAFAQEQRLQVEEHNAPGPSIPASLSKAQRPKGGGWMVIPGGRHGGFRKRKGKGWEHWYPPKTAPGERRAKDLDADDERKGAAPGRDARPEVTILSMGLGRDSMTMLALAKEGKLAVDGEALSGDDLDAVVFSDPGWEWPHTYALIPKVKKMCAEMGVPFYQLLHPKREGDTGWKRYHAQRSARTERRADDNTLLSTLTLGELAGKPSSFIEAKIRKVPEAGQLSLFAAEGESSLIEDAGTRARAYRKTVKRLAKQKKGESDADYRERLAKPVDFTIGAVRFTPEWVEASKDLPSIEERALGGAYHRRAPIVEDYERLCRITLRASAACTANQKILPINSRLLNDMSIEKFGVSTSSGAWGRDVKNGTRPKHRILIGIAADETHRMAGAEAKAQESTFVIPKHPLVDMGIAKKGEQPILDRHGLGHTRKSGCVGCHFQPLSWYWALKESQPESYARVVDYERKAIDHAKETGQTVKYLKGSKPLDEQVSSWRGRNPDATVDAVLDKEYDRKAPKGRRSLVILDGGDLKKAFSDHGIVPLSAAYADCGHLAHNADAETDMTKAPPLFYVPGELMKGQARGGKYIRRVPYRNPKTGKMSWRYYYRQSAAARGAQAGERVQVGKRYLEVLEVGEGGTVKFRDGDKTLTVSPDEWAEKIAAHYGKRYHEWAAKRAHQSINSVLRLVPRKLLLDLKGDTDQERLDDLRRRVPAVYGKLRAAFSRAGIDPIRAKHVVSKALERRGWQPEARAALLGGVIDKRIIGYREVIRGAENLSGGGLVTAGHVASAAELRAPGGKPGRFKAEADKTAKSAEGELAMLSKLLASAHASGDPKDAAKVLEHALGSEGLQKLQLLTQAFPGLKVGPVAEESREALLEVPSVAPRPQTTTEGAETLVYVADANGQPRALKARYKLIEAKEAIASHNAQHFGKRADYPTGVQERQYHTDRAEQRKVMNNARRMNPAFVVNTNPDSVNGPPMLNEDGIVLGGNSRAMSMQLVYLNHPEKASAMRTYLEGHAHEMGFTPDDVKALKNPMLVRVIEDPPKESAGGLFGEEPGGTRKRTKAEMGVLVRQMNESFTQSMDPRAMQVAMGRKLDDATVKSLAEGMEDGETLNQFLTSGRAQAFVAKLSGVGIIDSRNENQYKDPKTQRLNADGRDLVSRILVGRLVGDADVLSNTGARTVDAVAAATPYMMGAVASGPGYALGDDMAAAIRDLNELRQRAADKTLPKGSELDPKLSRVGFDRLYAQLGLANTEEGGGAGAARELESAKNERARSLLWALIKKPGPRQFANIFKTYVVQAGHNREGSMDMLREVKTPAQVLKDVIDRATSAKPKAAPAPEEKAPEKPSMSLALSRTADGSRYRVHSMVDFLEKRRRS